MENNKDYEKRLGRRLREAFLKDYEGPAMSSEDFHRLIEAAEKKKSHKKAVIGLAAACVAICLVCGGFIAGMSMRESASAGKDDETKTVQQGGSVVIGSGVSETDQNVGVSIKTYTDIEGIPEDLREQIHFLDSDEFELEKVKVTEGRNAIWTALYYYSNEEKIVVSEESADLYENRTTVLHDGEVMWEYSGGTIYQQHGQGKISYSTIKDNMFFSIRTEKEMEREKIETLFEGLNDVSKMN